MRISTTNITCTNMDSQCLLPCLTATLTDTPGCFIVTLTTRTYIIATSTSCKKDLKEMYFYRDRIRLEPLFPRLVPDTRNSGSAPAGWISHRADRDWGSFPISEVSVILLVGAALRSVITIATAHRRKVPRTRT